MTQQMYERVTYPVGLNPIDETEAFSVIAVGEALASLVTLQIECKQLDGSWRTFDVLAGETPVSVPGTGNIRFHIDYIQAQNVGQMSGTLYIRVVDDADVELLMKLSMGVIPGGIIGIGETVADMPMRDYALTVEVGHV